MVNVGKYAIHGCYGVGKIVRRCSCFDGFDEGKRWFVGFDPKIIQKDFNDSAGVDGLAIYSNERLCDKIKYTARNK